MLEDELLEKELSKIVKKLKNKKAKSNFNEQVKVLSFFIYFLII